jgi:hypothetical protein
MCKRSVNSVNYNSLLETMATCSDIYLCMHMCVPSTYLHTSHDVCTSSYLHNQKDKYLTILYFKKTKTKYSNDIHVQCIHRELLHIEARVVYRCQSDQVI